MSLADQIAALEADHTDAKAQIDALTAANAALKSENTAVKAENEAMANSVDQMVRFTADTRAMVEKLSSDALELLRSSRRETYLPPEVVRYAPKGEGRTPSTEERAELNTAMENITATRREPRYFTANTPDFQAALQPKDVYVTVAQAITEQAARPVREINEARADAEALDVPSFLRRDQVFVGIDAGSARMATGA